MACWLWGGGGTAWTPIGEATGQPRPEAADVKPYSLPAGLSSPLLLSNTGGQTPGLGSCPSPPPCPLPPLALALQPNSPLRVFTGHEDWVTGLALVPEQGLGGPGFGSGAGGLLVTASLDWTARVWDLGSFPADLGATAAAGAGGAGGGARRRAAAAGSGDGICGSVLVGHGAGVTSLAVDTVRMGRGPEGGVGGGSLSGWVGGCGFWWGGTEGGCPAGWGAGDFACKVLGLHARRTGACLELCVCVVCVGGRVQACLQLGQKGDAHQYRACAHADAGTPSGSASHVRASAAVPPPGPPCMHGMHRTRRPRPAS